MKQIGTLKLEGGQNFIAKHALQNFVFAFEIPIWGLLIRALYFI